MIYLENLDFGNILVLTQAGVPKKDVVLRFENPYDGVFLVNQRDYFCLKVL